MAETSKVQAVEFFAELYGGEHHIPGTVRQYGPGFCVNHRGSLATFDFSNLTRAVLLAHDRCMRLEISSAGSQCIKLIVHKRVMREGRMWERHPTIEIAVKEWRKKHAEPVG